MNGRSDHGAASAGASHDALTQAALTASDQGFVVHLHPTRVTERALRPTTTLGLGLICLALLALLTLSGGLLMLDFVPALERAYASVLDIEYVVPFGHLVRSVHRIAAHALIATMMLHLWRVALTTAYVGRTRNWLIGLALATQVLALAWTGTLLPWDSSAYWATRIAAQALAVVPACGPLAVTLLLGDGDVGPAALSRAYALHVTLLPVVLLVFVTWHLWRLRRAGGLARPSVIDEPTVPAWPHLVGREALVLLITLTLVLALALAFGAPLGPPADPSSPQNPEKAAWYFLGLQELVGYSRATGALWLVLYASLLAALPFGDRDTAGAGCWLTPVAARRDLGAALFLTLLVLFGLSAGLVRAAADAGAWQEVVNPGTASLALATLGGGTLAVRRGARTGLRLALLVLTTALVLFTVLGAWRGVDWQLGLPWQEARGGL